MGRFYDPASTVHAQDAYSNCTVSVPKLWEVFKACWEIGLAFEDQTRTLRFLLHPGERIRTSDPLVPNSEIKNSKCFAWCRLGIERSFFLSPCCTEVVPRIKPLLTPAQ